MNNQILRRTTMTVMFAALLSLVALSAAAQDMMGDKMGKMKPAKVTVAVIRADWCTACQKLEPAMTELMEQYKDRINFVVLDVTNDEKTAQSAATARKLGLTKFFEANKKKTSTVAVFGPKNKLYFKTDHNADRAAYVKAFDEAIVKAG